MKKLIGYVRVSTKEQGDSRNGLEAQRKAIEDFAVYNGYELVEIVEEVASGKLPLMYRPVLEAAVKRVLRMKDAHLIVSKLDRLSRDASFILNMMNTKASFIVADLGEAVSPLMIHLHAILAENERRTIGIRTKDAMASLRARGVKLGNPNAEDTVREDGTVVLSVKSASRLGAAATASAADEFAARVRPTIERMTSHGMTLTAIAAELNQNGMPTARGGQWTAKTVSNIINRWTN